MRSRGNVQRKPHDYKNQKEGFANEPQTRWNIIHDMIELRTCSEV
jgi:hypothetical protein